MKLRTITSKNQRDLNRRAFMSVSKIGKINILTGAINLLNLKSDDRLLFHQDLQNRSDWYIEKTKSNDGFVPRFFNNKYGIYVNFTSSFLKNEIFKSMGIRSNKSVRFELVRKFLNNTELFWMQPELPQNTHRILEEL